MHLTLLLIDVAQSR